MQDGYMSLTLMIRNEFGGQRFPITQSSSCLSVLIFSFPTRSMYFVYEYLSGIVEYVVWFSVVHGKGILGCANEQSKTFAGFPCLFVSVCVCMWVLG